MDTTRYLLWGASGITHKRQGPVTDPPPHQPTQPFDPFRHPICQHRSLPHPRFTTKPSRQVITRKASKQSLSSNQEANAYLISHTQPQTHHFCIARARRNSRRSLSPNPSTQLPTQRTPRENRVYVHRKSPDCWYVLVIYLPLQLGLREEACVFRSIDSVACSLCSRGQQATTSYHVQKSQD